MLLSAILNSNEANDGAIQLLPDIEYYWPQPSDGAVLTATAPYVARLRARLRRALAQRDLALAMARD